MKRHIALLPIALTLGFLQHVQAANPAPITEEVYKLAKDDLEQHYAREKLTCDSVTGNAKDICQAEVTGAEKVAQARLKAQHTGKQADKDAATEAGINARHKIAKERCDDLQGNQKDVCEKQAKAEHDKAMVSLKARQEIKEIRDEAAQKKRDAELKVAQERCDGLAGSAKDACHASAKARFNVN
jgi:hypothetical protein